MSLNVDRTLKTGLLLTLLATAACTPPAPPNVVLITLDTTRPDHLSCYGYALPTSPNLDRFAEQAVLYERAYATSSWTLPSHASLFTGLLPMQHGAQSVPEGPNRSLGYGVRPLADSFTTLAELLAETGYRTAGVVAGPALRKELGVAQGFERYDDEMPASHGKRAEQVADKAIAWITELGPTPFFLFINFFDPHAPYRPPPPFDADLLDPAEVAAIESTGKPLKALFVSLERHLPPRPVAEMAREVRDVQLMNLAGYDAEITYMDHHLGRLLDAIASSTEAERTLVIITGDHGESFGEHYFVSHGAHLYEHNVRVPLIVKLPGQSHTAGSRVETPVQNHRAFATILEAVGLDPPTGMDVTPLAGAQQPVVLEVHRSDSNIRLFGEFFARDLRAIVAQPYKLIESTEPRVELFNLDRDPEELDDIAWANSELVATLAEQLGEIQATYPAQYVEDQRAQLRPKTAEALKELGYLD